MRPLNVITTKQTSVMGRKECLPHLPSNSALTNVGNSCLGEKNSAGDKTSSVSAMLLFLNDVTLRHGGRKP